MTKKQMTQKQIDKEIQKAQNEFEEITLASYVFLNHNGLSRDSVTELLITSLLDVIENYEELRASKWLSI